MLWRRKGVGRSSAAVDERVGIGLGSDGLSLVRVSGAASGVPRILCCEHRAWDDPESLEQTLSRAVAECGLRGLPATCVLNSGDYQLRAIEKPPVPAEELRDAARWQLRDLVELDPDEAAVDVFELPDSQHAGSQRLFVAACPRATIERLVRACRQAGLLLDAVDIRELALRNLLCALPSGPGAVALLQLGYKQSLFAVARDDQLFLMRGMDTSRQQLESSLGEGHDGQLPESVLEHLALELQRSLDYFDSELRQGQVSQLWIAPSEFEVAIIHPFLERHLSARVSLLDFEQAFECEEHWSQAHQGKCVHALGGALRRENEQQIDLLHDLPEQARIAFGSQPLAASAGALVLLLTAAGAHGAWRTRSDAAALLAVESRVSHESLQIDALRAKVAELRSGDRLEKEVRQLEAEKLARQRLLETVAAAGAQDAVHFSDALEGLAHAVVPGLWLERIELDESGSALSLAGHALAPDLVPRFLEALAERPEFDGVEFRSWHLRENEAERDVIDFELATRDVLEATP